MSHSLLPTDENKARCKGYSDGTYDGWNKALNNLKDWLKNDAGMISVGSIRKRIREMRAKGPWRL